MDPKTALTRIATLLSEFNADPNAEPTELHAAVQDLHTWIAQGGFAPDWGLEPDAAHFYRTFLPSN